MIGTTIGHYEILEKIGEGGMGVVYKARDTKLNRVVALKFLPDRVNQDSNAKERFLQEAQAAAALNHPNIGTIYGVDEHEGHLIMSMEYVDGGTLHDSLSSTVGNTKFAIPIAIQIGEALQEAHARGIVHRDIKADNIMLTSRNQAKVMDFGLAKLRGALKLTRTSSTVGTLGYMAPEQIQGGEVDPRSDIFSFGVLLFEMLTGKLPFRGEHEAAMMYSILNEAPEPIGSHLPDASPELAHILDRALEKDPEDRYQSVADMVSELRRLMKQSSRVRRPSTAHFQVPPPDSTAVPSGVHPAVSAPVGSRKKILMMGGSAIFVVAILAVAFLLITGSPVEVNPDMTTRVLDVPIQNIDYPGLSGDGNWVTFTAATRDAKSHLYLMNASGGEPRAIISDSIQFYRHADLSFDASRIAYTVYQRNEKPAIYLTSALGGGPRILVEEAFLPRWQQDGQRIFFFRSPDWNNVVRLDIWSVAVDGSDERLEVKDTVSSEVGRISMTVSPDNRYVAWLRTFVPGEYQEIIITDRETGDERQLTFDQKNIDEVCWATNGQIIFSSNRSGNTNLWTIPAEGGMPVQITKGSGPDLGIRISSDNKKLLYYENQRIGDIWIGSLTTGVANQITTDDKIRFSPVLSPDGSQIAYAMMSGDVLEQSRAIYVSNRDGTNRRALTEPTQNLVSNLLWSPDGKRLAYAFRDPNDTTRTNSGQIVEINRPGAPRPVGEGAPYVWLDNDRLLLSRFKGTLLVSLASETAEPFFEDSTVGFPVPGNTHVFYRDHRSGRAGRWIVRVDGDFKSVGEPRKLMDIVPFAVSPARDFLMYVDDSGLVKMSLPSGRKQTLRNTYSGLEPQFALSVNTKTEEIVYTTFRNRAKLVMIENPFR